LACQFISFDLQFKLFFKLVEVIFTRADGKTVIELWRNGARVEDRDQLVNQGSKDVEVTGLKLDKKIDNLPTSVDVLGSNPITDIESFNVDSSLDAKSKSSNTNAEVLGSKPAVDGDSESLLNKLRSAIR
jgi:hypothetical protein